MDFGWWKRWISERLHRRFRQHAERPVSELNLHSYKATGDEIVLEFDQSDKGAKFIVYSVAGQTDRKRTKHLSDFICGVLKSMNINHGFSDHKGIPRFTGMEGIERSFELLKTTNIPAQELNVLIARIADQYGTRYGYAVTPIGPCHADYNLNPDDVMRADMADRLAEIDHQMDIIWPEQWTNDRVHAAMDELLGKLSPIELPPPKEDILASYKYRMQQESQGARVVVIIQDQTPRNEGDYIFDFWSHGAQDPKALDALVAEIGSLVMEQNLATRLKQEHNMWRWTTRDVEFSGISMDKVRQVERKTQALIPLYIEDIRKQAVENHMRVIDVIKTPEGFKFPEKDGPDAGADKEGPPVVPS